MKFVHVKFLHFGPNYYLLYFIKAHHLWNLRVIFPTYIIYIKCSFQIFFNSFFIILQYSFPQYFEIVCKM